MGRLTPGEGTMSRFMTKAEVERQFREAYMPGIRLREEGVKDSGLRCEEWRIYIDALAKSGFISSHSYRNWGTPKFC